MAITIKQTRKGSSVYMLSLEYNPPVTSTINGGPVYEEPLRLSVYTNPTTLRMQLFNHDNMERAESIRKYREEQINKGELKLFTKEVERDLVDFFRETAKRTDVNYRASFKWFSDFMHGRCSFDDVDAGLVVSFRKHLMDSTSITAEKRLELFTAAQYFNQFRYVLREAFNNGFLSEDLHDCVDPISTGDSPRTMVTVEEIVKLRSTPCSQRQIPMMCWFIALTGVRYSFVMNLRWENVISVGVERPFIITKTQRSGRDDILYLSQEALNCLGKRIKTGVVFSILGRPSKTLHQWERDAGVRETLGFEQFRIKTLSLQKYGRQV